MFNRKPYTPEQQSALAQSLMQQSQSPQQSGMVGGRYISSGLAGALAQVGKGYLGGRLQGIANENQKSQSNALTQALMADDPQQSLAGLSDNPMAQKYAQQLALKGAESGITPQTKLIRGEEIGAPEGSVYQLTKDGYKEVYAPESQKMPSSVQEYEYAKQQGYQGTFNDFVNQQKRSGAASNTISIGGGRTMQVGDIPKGFQLEYNDQGLPVKMTPIEGSDASIERQIRNEKKIKMQEKEKSTAGLLSEDIGRAKKILGENPYLTSGFFGNVLKDWAGSGAADFKQLSETIGANISFDYLNQMRQNSPTGAALGNITERELDLLRATAGSISQTQSPAQLMRNLDRLEGQFDQVIHGTKGSETSTPIGSSDNFSAVAPNGKTYSFGSQEALNQFKQKAGIP